MFFCDVVEAEANDKCKKRREARKSREKDEQGKIGKVRTDVDQEFGRMV